MWFVGNNAEVAWAATCSSGNSKVVLCRFVVEHSPLHVISATTGWHQDRFSYHPAADGVKILTCWIPFTDVTSDMGTLQILPASHKLGFQTHVPECESCVPVSCRCKTGNYLSSMHLFNPVHAFASPAVDDSRNWKGEEHGRDT